VINFGPIQGEVSEFVETYSYDLYQPELIFVSVSEKEFAAKPSRFLAFKNGVVGNEKFHIQEGNYVIKLLAFWISRRVFQNILMFRVKINVIILKPKQNKSTN